jgi:hypothetical protein
MYDNIQFIHKTTPSKPENPHRSESGNKKNSLVSSIFQDDEETNGRGHPLITA